VNFFPDENLGDFYISVDRVALSIGKTVLKCNGNPSWDFATGPGARKKYSTAWTKPNQSLPKYGNSHASCQDICLRPIEPSTLPGAVRKKSTACQECRSS